MPAAFMQTPITQIENRRKGSLSKAVNRNSLEMAVAAVNLNKGSTISVRGCKLA
jgi:hypothetical protein